MGTSKTIGMIGLGGSGMRGLGYLLAQKGNKIVGSDNQYESLVHELKNEPFELMDESAFRKVLPKCGMVIFTDALEKDDSLLIEARRVVSEVVSYNEAVGQLSREYSTIAVAGTHGKSSTTAMLAHVLIDSGLDPTVLIGAGVPAWNGRHARLGKSDLMIVEADEYRDHFLALKPKHVVVTSIEYDHPDYFSELNDVVRSFQLFLGGLQPGGKVITLKSVAENLESLDWPASTIFVDDSIATDIEVGVPGEHMKRNAALALSLAKQLKVDRDGALKTIRNFNGIKRRFESLGQYEAMEIISDYGHHPTEIKATLKAARSKHEGKRILVLFEGHTLSRLQEYKNEFIEALSEAEGLVITPAYLPRGQGEAGASEASHILDEIESRVRGLGIEVIRMKNYDEMLSILKKLASKYDIGIYFSAGALDGEMRKRISEK